MGLLKDPKCDSCLVRLHEVLPRSDEMIEAIDIIHSPHSLLGRGVSSQDPFKSYGGSSQGSDEIQKK